MKASVNIITCLMALTLPVLASAYTVRKEACGLRGNVYTEENGRRIPIEYAVVVLEATGLYSTTDGKGAYIFERLDPGKYVLSVSMIGYEKKDTAVVLSPAAPVVVDFLLKESSFRLKEVSVTAQRSKAGEATASLISRQAIDHSQTSSLKDIMQLLPGAAMTNPNLASSQSLSLRTASPTLMNSLGTCVIVDGAPLSNNANMEGISSAMTGTATTIAGNALSAAGSLPNSGIDVRSISTDNIESVEVIRGIPSVQYGDLTSGAVIIKSKTGAEPLTIRLKTDPKIFQAYMSKGLKLGGRSGEMHLSSDYAYSNAKTTEAYAHYQRFNMKGVWSRRFGDLNSSFSLEMKYGKDTRERNPDDKRASVASGGYNIGYRISTNGVWNINKGWLKSLRYDLSNSFTYKKAFREQDCINAVSIYSTNMVHGTTVSNTPGRHIYDSSGKEITAFGPQQEKTYATYMPYQYFSHYDFYGKELNTYAKLSLNLYRNWGRVSDRILIGADFKSDGNLGEGLVFPEGSPPYRSSNPESGYRPRPLYDIPFVTQTGLFAENSFKASLLGRDFNLTAGLRLDRVNTLTALAPRINASYEILKGVLTIRGGYGLTSKAPTSAYLYPNKAYYDQTNHNRLDASAPLEKLVIATTYIFDTDNPALEIARNRKFESGLDFVLFRKYKLSLTFYDELMKNGYGFGADFRSIHWMPYKYYSKTGNDAEGNPVLSLSRDTHTFFVSYMPLNKSYEHNRGVEWELNLGRFNAIRTSFFLNGAWMHTMNTSEGFTFDIRSNAGSSINSHVAVYKPRMRKYHSERTVTALRVTHNIPVLGLAATLTTNLNLYTKEWTEYENDEIPQYYISNGDGMVHEFTNAMAESPEFRYMLEQRSPSRFIIERSKATLVFNLNVSKEIKDFLTASFYVNNVFNHRPLDPSEITQGAFRELNNPMYFGFELKFKLK